MVYWVLQHEMLVHYIDVGIADFVTTFWSSPRAPPRVKIFWFQIKKNMSNINKVSCSTSTSDHSCCQTATAVVKQRSIIVTPAALLTVDNRVRPSELVVTSHRRLRWQRLWHDANVKQEAGQLLFAWWRYSCCTWCVKFDSQVLCAGVVDSVILVATLSSHLFAYNTSDWYHTVSQHSLPSICCTINT